MTADYDGFRVQTAARPTTPTVSVNPPPIDSVVLVGRCVWMSPPAARQARSGVRCVREGVCVRVCERECVRESVSERVCERECV